MSENKSDKIKVPFHKASISKCEKKAVMNVLKSGWLTTGKYSFEFERLFSESISEKGEKLNVVNKNRSEIGLNINKPVSLAVNSNTSGMILAMEALGIKKGNAIITTPYTFVSTAACARHLGAEVYFADIESDSYSIDPKKVEEILEWDLNHGKKVRAIVPVHIGGNLCNMKEICLLAKKYDVKVIEDAAHSYPSETSLGFAGVIGDAGVFSFYATKTITTAEGGMVCTRDPEIAKRISVMRLHGMDRPVWNRYTSKKASWEYDIVDLGYKFNLPDVLSAIGCEQVKRAKLFYDKRKKIAEKYNEAFKNCDFITCPPDSEGNSWHLYLLRLNLDKLKINRSEFAKKLQEKGIGISVHFIPLFHFTYWKKLYPDFKKENFINAENQYQRTISIPIWPEMSKKMIDYVIKTIIETGNENHA